MTPLSYFLYVLGIHVSYTIAGQCLSICRDPDDCPPEAPQPNETPPIWQTCPSGPADGAQWACQASDIDFPTVACLVADMKVCGLIGAGGHSTVFYSFGATTVQARTKFRDTLNPKGVMFNDALDANYWDKVISLPKFHMDQKERMAILVARYAEAMATVSTGEVFFVVQKYNGDGGGKGAYQLPTDTSSLNVWRAYEFPTLQRNAAVTKVTSVDLSNNQNQQVDWQPNNNDEELPASDASNLVVPPPPAGCPQKVKRVAAACVTCITFATPGGPTGTVSVSGSAPATAGITPTPTPSSEQPVLKCHGVSGDTWMLSRDQALSAAEQFCKQDVKDKEYFQGSADSVQLAAHNSDDSKALSTINDCIGQFKQIIDNCDGNDLLNNPHNYKFGGTYTSADGWDFKVQPTAVKPDEDSCDVSYKFLLDEFEVRGKNFPDAKLGANGEGLKKQIDGCGAVTDWHFEWTPDDVKYQWYAYGNLPIGTKSCMGRAVQSAGGSSAGNCHGSG